MSPNAFAALSPVKLMLIVVVLLGSAVGLYAAGSGIGTVTANGNVRVDHSLVLRSATLFEGSTVDTTHATSDIRLAEGAKLRLAPETHATVFAKRLVLEAGYGQMEAASSFEMQAHSLRISTAEPNSVVRVRVGPNDVVMVAAVRGAASVRNAAGLLVATVENGKVLDFDPQPAGAAAATRVSGCLLEKEGKLAIADQTTNVLLELSSLDLRAEVGNRLDITGRAEPGKSTVNGASQRIKVADWKRVAKGGCSAVAKKFGASAAAGAVAAAGTGAAGAAGTAAAGAGAAAAGLSAATVAVIGGVAAAATVGGMAAAGSLPGQGNDTPSVSR